MSRWRHATRRRKHGLARVLIADWDVHHGNGTQDIFYNDGRFFSSARTSRRGIQGPARRARREKDRQGRDDELPFPAGSGRAEVLGVFRERLMPAMDSFRPELVVISAGFDSRRAIRSASFGLTDEDFADLTRMLMDVADKHAGGPGAVGAGRRV
jgi:acetoin utilization deacetylase AcuC-like enzyme